jgi:hypothetical protein
MKLYNKILIPTVMTVLFSGCGGTSSITNTDTTNDSSTNTSTSSDTTSTAKNIDKYDGWYMRVTAKATQDNTTYMHNTAGVFGELKEASDTLDSHDVPSKGNAILQVRFVNSSFNNTTEYYSDYRHYKGYISDKATWDILVVNNNNSVDLSNADLSLDIKNIKRLSKVGGKYQEQESLDTTIRDSLHLIDLDNQIIYSYSELKNADLSMDGKHYRHFRIVLGHVNSNDLTLNTKIYKLVPYNAKVVSSSNSKFGTPPSI